MARPHRAALLAVIAAVIQIVPPTSSASPSIGYDASARVARGESVEITLRTISTDGYPVLLEIEQGPTRGKLSAPVPVAGSKDTFRVRYSHDGSPAPASDSFRFKFKTGPDKSWARRGATVSIFEPAPVLAVSPLETLDFGEVFLGGQAFLSLSLANKGGGVLRGRLEAGAPWHVADDGIVSLSPGASTTLLVGFAPLEEGTAKGALEFLGNAVGPKLGMVGHGVHRFDLPGSLSYPPDPLAEILVVEVRNKTGEQLPLIASVPQPLRVDGDQVIEPGGTGMLELVVPKGSSPGGAAILTVSDGFSMREIKVELPPPPASLQWNRAGGGGLGRLRSGETRELAATVQNTGERPASVLIEGNDKLIQFVAGQIRKFTLQPGESRRVDARWIVPSTPGPVSTGWTAHCDGRSTPIVWQGEIESSPEAAPPSAVQGVAAAPTPTPPNVISREAMERSRPRNILHSIENGVALITWDYSGAEPVEFRIKRKVMKVHDPVAGGGFLGAITNRNIPEAPPAKEAKVEWALLDPKLANVEFLGGGKWQAVVPDLQPGFHDVRIDAVVSGSKQVDGVLLTIRVPPLESSSSGWKLWLWGIVFFLSCMVLWRSIRSRLQTRRL